MVKFTHLHVHTQYSILDGMSTIPDLVKRCLQTGMNSLAITDHGNMFGIKEFFDYVDKHNGAVKSEIKDIEKELETETDAAKQTELQAKLAEVKQKTFKPIFGCEVYVAKVTKTNPTGDRTNCEGKETVMATT